MAYNIIKPCSEDWKSMSPVPGGRFCGKCNKKVHDLSIPGNQPRADESLCGMKYKATTHATSYQAYVSKYKRFRYFFLLFTLLFSRQGIAQVKEMLRDSSSDKSLSPDENPKNIFITGILEDKENKEPIVFAYVVAYDENNNQLGSVLTDIDGQYKFDLKNIKGKKLSLKAAYIGYQTVVIQDVPLTSSKRTINIKLKNSGNVLGELIEVGGAEWTAEFDAFGQKRSINRNEWNHSPK
jgi:VCBS repeat-containing protein